MPRGKKRSGVTNEVVTPALETQETPQAPQFKLRVSGQIFAFGGKYFTARAQNWTSPSGQIYTGVADSQELLKWIYDYAPVGANWVEAPEGYEAPWSKFV